MGKSDIRGIPLDELLERFRRKNMPAFRAKQVFSWVHRNGAASFEEMRNLPKDLWGMLGGEFRFAHLKELKRRTSKDGTAKFLFELEDGARIEAVLLDDDGRRTVCVSTQAGCRMNCAICATARGGLKRNLSSGEIVGQAYEIEREFGRVSNVVFMGMGEPLDNYDNVIRSVRLLNSRDGKNIGQRHITISTCGLAQGIRKLAREKMQIRLAISLNFVDEAKRTELMPVNRRHPIREVLDAAKEYAKMTGRRITFEYVLVGGLNDSQKDADGLADLIRGIRANVNLIEINPFPGAGYSRPASVAVRAFRKRLEERGVEVSQRFRRGSDIDAACGQLSGREHAI